MMYLGSTALQAVIKSLLITVTRTFVIPDDLYLIWVDGSAGGGAGGNGDPTPGGGGGGGSSGSAVQQEYLSVVPGETLTATIGAGGINGAGGNTTLVGSVSSRAITCGGGTKGGNGANPNGGNGFGVYGGAGGAGGAGAGVSGPSILSTAGNYHMTVGRTIIYQGGASGGALNYNGGATLSRSHLTAVYGGTGSASGGGGGAGGHNPFGSPGSGGNGGSAGGNSTVGYGGGGGGGGGGATQGGNGGPGFLRIYYISAHTII